MTQDGGTLSAIMDAAADAMIVSDARGTIQRANKAAQELFGHSEAIMLGQNVSMLMPRSMADLHDGFMNHHLSTGEEKIIGIGREVEGLRADGTIFPLHLSVGRSDVDGHQTFVGILHDLTQRRAAQEALARSQRLDAVGQMTGGIAHDFNNLLTVVIGNLEMLELQEQEPAKRALIADALDAAELGAEMTARLLVFARRGNLAPSKTDLRDACDDTLAMLRRTLGAKYQINTDYEDGIDVVMVDPAQFQSSLVNLAINARDAMEDGGDLLISVSNINIDDTYIAQETDIAPGRYVRVFVSDNGGGMTQDAQKRAFEPFFTTKVDRNGTGLGLAMVYGFVRQSGGHITLYSELGVGTSIGLYFPALDAETSAQTAQGAQENQSFPLGNGAKILVVEDNPSVRKLTVQRLVELGYRTVEAETGDAALHLLQDGQRVDAVFSDLVMPGKLNGYDLAHSIYADYPDIPVLLTSGYASDVVTSRLTEDMRFPVLHKPYRLPELAKKLHELLG